MILKFVMYGVYGFATSAVFVLCWVFFGMLLALLMRIFGWGDAEDDE